MSDVVQITQQSTFDSSLVAAPSSKDYQGYRVPTYMDRGLLEYVHYGRIPGDFLTAVIRNDLKNAVGHADSRNLENLPAYVFWLYNEAPKDCWGSKEKMDAWVDHEGLSKLQTE